MTHSFPTRRSSELGWRQRGHRLDQGSGESQPLPAGVDGALGEQIPVDGKPAQIDRRAEPAARDADGPGRDAQGSESGDAGRWPAGFVGGSDRKRATGEADNGTAGERKDDGKGKMGEA